MQSATSLLGGDTEDPENSLALFSSEHDLENCNPDFHGQIKHLVLAAVISPLPLNGKSPRRVFAGNSSPFNACL